MSRRLGDVLIASGKINETHLNRALTAQLVFGGHLGTCLLEMGLLDEESLGEALSRMSGVPYADFDTLSRVPSSTLRALPPRLAQKHKVVPLRLDGRILHLAMIDPRNILAIDEISFVTGYRIVPWVTPEVRILQALEKHYDFASPPRFVTLARQLAELPSPRERLRPDAAAPSLLDDSAIRVPAPAAGQAAMAAAATAGAAQSETREAAHPAGMADMSDPWEEEGPARNWSDVAEAIETAAAKADPPVARRPAAEEVDTCPNPASSPGESPVTWMASVRRLAEAQSVDEVASATLAYASARLPRALLLVARGGHAMPWSWHGWAADAASWRRLEFPLQEEGDSLFSLVSGGAPHYLGAVAGQAWAADFYGSLGADPPRTALLIPIRLKGRAAAYLYADGGDAEILAIDIPSMVSLCTRAAFALQIMILRNKILAS